MNDCEYAFVIGAEASPELMLVVASIGRSLARGHVVKFADEEPEELIVRDKMLARLRVPVSAIDPGRSRLIICGASDLLSGKAIADAWDLSIIRDPSPAVRLEGHGKRHIFPLVMSSTILRPFGRTLSELPRVTVCLDGGDDRRSRMIGRVCEELAGRRWPHTLVVVAPTVEVARTVSPTECWVAPGAFELGALMASTTVMLEPVEGDDAPSPASCLASSAGVPVISHSAGLLARRALGEIRAVDEWSPDAYTDAVITAVDEVPEDLSWGTEFDAVVEDFGRVVESA